MSVISEQEIKTKMNAWLMKRVGDDVSPVGPAEAFRAGYISSGENKSEKFNKNEPKE